MKLFVIAALIAVAAAGRLEHLERSYLPPDNNAVVSARSFGPNGGFGSPSSHGSFSSPSSHGSFGSSSSHGSFGSSAGSFGSNSGAFGAAGAGLQRQNAGVSFAGATSNQYLPPNQGSFGSNAAPHFGSAQGFGGQSFRSQQYRGQQAGPAQQYGNPTSQYSSHQSSSFGAPNYQSQSAATSRQYLAPRTSSFQNPPQQAFDEQTGYHY